MEQAMPFGNENARPEQQLPDITNISLPQVSQGTSQPLPQQIPDPMPQINTANVGGRSTAARPPSIPASTAPQRNHDHPTRISNPVDIRRASVGTMSRARQRYSTSNNPAFPEWLLENGNIMFRRDSPTSVEYVANLAPIARGAKRVASRRALASLQSVNIADLPESERTCVICYNDFGVANPEGVNEAPLRLPKCKHVFGDHCIKKWFQESDSCPYCRDKVHSEIQNFPSRRNNSGNRLPATLLAAEEFFEYYTDSDREPLRTRDRNVSGPESSAQQEVEFSNFAVLDSMGFRSPSGSLRAETNARHPTRPPWGPGYDRRSPPIAEHDRRRRPRQRARNSQSSNRGNVSGSQNSNGPSQPLFTWNTALPGNPLTEAPAPNAYVAPFENLPPHLISRHDDYVALTGNHPSGLPQMRPDAIAGGFSSETPNGAFDVHMLNSENVHPNVSAVSGHVVAQPSMFTSYQQQS
ncbi:hypothetical protein NPX13_g10791 [Xylaria arbuscula]|uniref:RING-type domain-containing protein n=1 Tax=Xylaria arbuscula TaxID=114810 RepID=A0A9W8TGA0_9PEZI|nr:hypothetical protein NPX13_g10791 [Xylaria arbuscula]